MRKHAGTRCFSYGAYHRKRPELNETYAVTEWKGWTRPSRASATRVVSSDRWRLSDSAGKEEPGHTLVVCCEGNAGFYEMGATSAPLEAGYSVLGWNHPGFGGSSVCMQLHSRIVTLTISSLSSYTLF